MIWLRDGESYTRSPPITLLTLGELLQATQARPASELVRIYYLDGQSKVMSVGPGISPGSNVDAHAASVEWGEWILYAGPVARQSVFSIKLTEFHPYFACR